MKTKTLTANQIEALQTALTLWNANGAYTTTIKGSVYNTLVARGYFTTQIGRSVAGGRHARWYLFTAEGLAVAQIIKKGA